MKTCQNCKKEFEPKRDTKGKYCSNTCWVQSREHTSVVRKCLKGKPLSKEHRLKMRLAKLGTKRSLSAREKSSQSMKGHKWSTSTLKKRIESLRGKKRTGQAYQNILDANARAHGYKSYAEMPPNERPDWRGLQWSWTRKSIKERDDHTCQKCNRQNHLQVHHITPWRVSQDNSPKNLVTLCIWCHQSINQFTIKEQFIMFAHAIKKPLVGAL